MPALLIAALVAAALGVILAAVETLAPALLPPPLRDWLAERRFALVRVHWPYAKYMYVHKRGVYRAGRKLRAPLWRLILHDASKFRWDEWHPYAWYFYGGVATFDRQRAFDRAWIKHQQRNDHHWQHHILRGDDGLTRTLPMSDDQRREMLADWIGAGQAQGKSDTRGWYRANCGGQLIHVETREWVERQLFGGLTMADYDREMASRTPLSLRQKGAVR